MDGNCDICRGQGRVALPVHQRVSVMFDPSLDMKPSSRSYPCPECAGVADDERAAILEVRIEVGADQWPELQSSDYVQNAATRMLADKVVKSGAVRFDVEYSGTFRVVHIRATLGVLSKEFVASIQDRSRRRQFWVAGKVVEAAQNAISHWNSLYTGGKGNIPKDVAMGEVASALRKVMDQETRDGR